MENGEIRRHISLLQKFTMYLAGELSNTQVSIDEIKGTAMIKGTREGKIFSFSIEQRDEENSSVTANNRFVRKSDYKDEINRLYALGIKQTEIAKKLHISQSLVSRLLKDNF